MQIKNPWLVWTEIAIAVVVMVVEVLKKKEHGRS